MGTERRIDMILERCNTDIWQYSVVLQATVQERSVYRPGTRYSKRPGVYSIKNMHAHRKK